MGKTVNILGFVGPTVATTQPCSCTKAAMDTPYMKGHGYVPFELYLQKQVVGRAWHADRALLLRDGSGGSKKFSSKFVMVLHKEA